jgi:hydroxymethylbilane synthase
MIQTQQVIDLLSQQWPGLTLHIEQIRTTGDAVTNVPLSRIGGDGVFVMEIERALQEGRIDLAVHSLKDVPTVQPEGVRIVTVGQREDVRDVLVWKVGADRAVPALRIGTSSLRRTAQLRLLFPEADILPIRGNVDTRLRKLDAGEYDATVLASAGLRRLGLQLEDRATMLNLEQVMPAPGQGALAVEIRDEPEMLELLAPLVNTEVSAATRAERMFMRRLGAGCYLPIAAYADMSDGVLTLRGLVISLDGRQQVRVSGSVPWSITSSERDAEQSGVQLAEQALAQGASEIIEALNVMREQERQHA